MEWYGILLLNLYYAFWMYYFYKLGKIGGYRKGYEENGQALDWNKRVYEERENQLESELDFERKRSEHWTKKWEEKNAKLGKMLDKNARLEEELCELKKSREIHPCGSIKKSNISDDAIWNFDLNWVEYHDVLFEWKQCDDVLNGYILKNVEFKNGFAQTTITSNQTIDFILSRNKFMFNVRTKYLSDRVEYTVDIRLL